jgi:hypothetical protein
MHGLLPAHGLFTVLEPQQLCDDLPPLPPAVTVQRGALPCAGHHTGTSSANSVSLPDHWQVTVCQ